MLAVGRKLAGRTRLLAMKKWIIILLALGYGMVHGQTQSSQGLSAIHFDRPMYMGGDTAWFQVYFPDFLQTDQAVAHILLLQLDFTV